MVYVYVLQSLRNGKRYVGYTNKAPLERLEGHNSGATPWAKQNKPFVLLHVEEFDNRVEAHKRELFLKSGQGRKWLDKNISKTAPW